MTPNIGKKGSSGLANGLKTTAKSAMQVEKSTTRLKKERQKSPKYKRTITKGSRLGGWQVLCLLLFVFLMIPQPKEPEKECPKQENITEKMMLFQNRLLEKMQTGGCTGINKFLTFTTFSNDLEGMKSEYLAKYSSEIGNGLGSKTLLLPPSALTFSMPGYDCEDFALAASCLANYYDNVTCELYYSVTRNGHHVGMECIEEINNNSIYIRI